MTEKPNFIKLGAFLLIGTALIVAAVILFGSGAFAQERVYFETYFSESVHGLTRGSPVQESGVAFGIVEEISFVRDDYELPSVKEGFSEYHYYVRVVCSVAEGDRIKRMPLVERKRRIATLIENGLRLRMGSNLVTGQAYLEATYLDAERFPVMEVSWEPEYVYIPSAPSTFTTMKDSVDSILLKIDELNLKKIEQDVNKLLSSVNQAVEDADVKALSNEIQSLFAEARETNQRLKDLIASEDPGQQTSNVAETVTRLNKTLQRFDELIARGTPQVEQILESLARLSANLEQLSENLKKHPSELIFSQPPPKSENVQ